jgi:hypothetical protein
MPFLTVFSAPKPFTDPHIAIIQRNAIRSWCHLGFDVEVLLVGEEAGLAEVADECRLPLLTNVSRNDSGTPLVNSIFELAREYSTSNYLVYVNADILLTSDLVKATRQIAEIYPSEQPFLLIGQRWDLEVDRLLDFSTENDRWEFHLCDEVRRRGRLHRPAGSDYFVFPRSIFLDIPDFAIGRAGWDNWMIYHACQQGWPVIDGTPSIMIVHQSHDYRHLSGGQPHYNQVESQQNMAIAGGLANMYMVLDANWRLVDGKIRRAPFTLMRLVRFMERWLMPKEGNFRGVRGVLARRFRRFRRMSQSTARLEGNTLEQCNSEQQSIVERF